MRPRELCLLWRAVALATLGVAVTVAGILTELASGRGGTVLGLAWSVPMVVAVLASALAIARRDHRPFRWAVAALVSVPLALGLSTCGGESGPSSPAQAVERFLAVMETADAPRRAPSEEARREAATDLWRRACELIDPRLRGRLRGYEDRPADATNCGAAVLLAVLYTGDTGEMLPPDRISGEVVSMTQDGDLAVVRTRVRYTTSARGSAPKPPAEATANVLVVKRGDSWWMAVPAALNPLAVVDGLSESELRDAHEDLLDS